MATVLITGGTGLIGTALAKSLIEKKYTVIILTRGARKQMTSVPPIHYASWSITEQKIDKEALAKADFIIHLTGAGLADRRWTKRRKQEIIDSRVKSSRLIADSLKTTPHKVKAVVSSSAIGWYGPDPSLTNPHGEEAIKPAFVETDPAAKDFLGTTCKLWEESIEPLTQLGIRLIKLRTGIVLSNNGGVLKEFEKPLRFGVAAILGSGNQIISWIHIDDLVNLFITSIEKEKMSGVYNAVAPHPVSNKELVMQLARIKQKFFIPVHVPGFVLKLLLGEMSIEVLKSARISSAKTELSGFKFLFPDIRTALTDLLGR